MAKPTSSQDTMSKYKNQLYLSIVIAKYWKYIFNFITIVASKHMNPLKIKLKGAYEFHTENYKTLLIAKRAK